MEVAYKGHPYNAVIQKLVVLLTATGLDADAARGKAIRALARATSGYNTFWEYDFEDVPKRVGQRNFDLIAEEYKDTIARKTAEIRAEVNRRLNR